MMHQRSGISFALRSPMDKSTASQSTVAAIMTPAPICVRTNTLALSVLQTLQHANVSGAPVLDESGKLVGVISRADLLAACNPSFEFGPSTSAADLMTPLVFTVRAEASVAHAAALMAVEGIHRAVVVGSHGDMIGIVSSLDIMRWLGERDGYLES
jgi:CBS domain-containing protein